MNTNHLAVAASLSDEELLTKMRNLSQQTRDVTVELIAHLVEVARRGLHRGEGPGKLFPYLTEVLRFSGAAAWNRIQAARAVRRFPVVLDLLADGSVNLTSIRMNLTSIRILVPHLTKANHRAVLDEAKGKSTREIKTIAARLAPRPDVPSTVRKLPAPTPAAADAPGTGGTGAPTTPPFEGPGRSPGTRPGPPPPVKPVGARPVLEPLAPARYRMQITLDEEMHDDLRCLQDLMRREIPDGDPAEIVRQGLKMLRADRERKAFSATARPRSAEGSSRPDSRDIEAAVQREVWARDGGQCAFVGRDGRRCTERSYLEFHHLRAYALGGGKTAENISLRCRAHNAYEAELVFNRIREDRERHVPVCFETNPSRERRPN